MGFWVTLGWYLLFTAASIVLRPRPRRGAPQPSSRGEFQRPTAEEGRPIPYLAGTCLIEGPNVLWNGDYLAQEIIESSVVVGYKYFMGLMYGLCLGPIDRLLDVRFDQKILTLAPLDIAAGKVLRVKVGATSYDVDVPSGEFATAHLFGKSVTAAIRAATPDQDVRVVYGYEIEEGDQLRWRTGLETHIARIRGGHYASGTEMAAALHTAFRESNFPSASYPRPEYDEGTGEMTIGDLPGPPAGEVLASGSTVLASLGFSDLADFNLPATGLETRADRFFFFLPAGTEIEWSHGATNCHAIFGMSLAAPDMTSSSVADQAVATPTPLATYVEFDGGARVTFAAPNLFGGEKVEGGIEGVLDVYYGGDGQIADDYLETQWNAPAPAFRGLCYAVARKLYQGTAPYLKNVSFVAERCPNGIGLTGGKHQIEAGGGAIGFDANAACVIYELLTNPQWGMGMPASLIDIESFRAAGETLFDEGFGVSINIEQSAEGLDLIDELRRHIDGVLYPDPDTGLFVLKLVRADYDPLALPLLDEDIVTNVSLSRSAWEETRNVIKVQYVDRTLNHTPRVMQIQNLANIQMLGRQVVEEIPFRAISHPGAARIVGERALRSLSYPLGRLEISATRAARRTLPGSVFRLNWAPLGISGLICRATRVGKGEIRSNTISIEAAEDVYGLDRATFVPIVSS